MKRYIKRIMSGMLALIMFMITMPICSIVSFAADILPSNYLEGWRVDVAWSTMSRDYVWNAERDEARQAKLYVTYRVDNAERDYNAGDLSFTIYGIDSALRGGMLKAQSNAADNADALWSYTHDELTGTYVFTNKFELKQGKSMNGGFEFMWDMEARDNRNDFSFEASPVFEVKGATQNSINLPAITYNFTSKRDRYRLDMTYRKLDSEEWGSADREHTWYIVDNIFDKDRLARGLYRSSYYVWFEIPHSEDPAKQLTIDDFEFIDVQPVYDDENDRWGFYLWENENGDISDRNFQFGVDTVKAEGVEIEFHGHLSRLYNDENEWIEVASDEHEQVDDSVRMTIESYEFHYNGNSYTLDKSGKYYPESPYLSRFNSKNLYNDTIIRYRLEGGAKKIYDETLAASNVEFEPILVEDGDMIFANPDGPTFDETRADNGIATIAWGPGQTVHDEDEVFDMVLGDDKLAIETNSGEIRDFEDYEYDIAYITLTTNEAHSYEVFAATTQDEYPGNFIQVATGTTVAEKGVNVQLGEPYKAVYVVVHDMLAASSKAFLEVGIRLHFDWDEQSTLDTDAKINSEGHFVNFGYLRALYGESNDIFGTLSYDGVYGEKIINRDEELYGEVLFRDYHKIFLRSSTTNLDTTIKMDEYKYDGAQRYDSTISATGSIRADELGSLKKFSMYITIPEGVSTDFNNNTISVVGSGVFENSSLAADLAQYVTISEDSVDGKRVLVFDFDMTQAPLEISEKINIEISFPVYLTLPNFKEYGSRYTTNSYLMILDDGIDKFAGMGLAKDEYDLDRDGSKSDYLVRASSSKTVYDVVSEWNESVMKYVKSAYTDGYEKEAVVKAYKDGMDAETAALSNYSYRLDYELGSNAAANIVFYDSIEQGAAVKVEGEGSDDTVQIDSEWQGQFQNIDASDMINQGGIVTFYWSEDPEMMKKSTTEIDGVSPAGLNTVGWNPVPDNNWDSIDKSKVKSVAVKMDTSNLEKGVLQAPATISLYINMLAPTDSSFANKIAVNQFTVGYMGYNLDGTVDGERYVLPSNATKVTLMDSVATLTIQKVDPENILKYDDEGNPVYAKLTGGSFNIYNSEEELLDGSPFSLNSMGQIVLSNIEYGTYYWEEVEAPQGYIKQEGLHEIICDKPDNLIEIKNERKVATAVLYKYDKQYMESGNPRAIGPAYFNLYKANGEKVYYIKRGANEYTDNPSEPGASDEFIATGCSISKLPWGSYYWKEIQAPPGYVLDDEPIYFTVGAADDANISDDEFSGLSVPPISQSQSTSFVKFIKAFNEEKRGSIRIIKQDNQPNPDGRTYKTLEGAVFNLYRTPNGLYDGNTPILVKSNVRTNSVGEIEFNDLQYGYYYFEEVRAPQGYVLPSNATSSSPYNFVGGTSISEYNCDKTIEYTIRNTRIKGRVQLIKKDNLGQYVAGAEYELWYRSDMVSESTPYSKLGSKTTDDDGVITFENLQWGDYYFKETKAPEGYAVSDEEIRFSINAQNAASVISIDATDERAKGRIQLIKVDKTDNDLTLSGAEFELYDLKGKLMTPGSDYQTDYKDNKIITNADGQVNISGLSQGSYYLQEIKAPSGYSKKAEPVRFSVTLKSSQTLQVLKVENARDSATITVNKKINEVYDEFGNPTFVFKVTNKSTGKTYTKSITLSKTQLTGSVTFEVDAGSEYEIYEYESSRYDLTGIGKGTDDTNISDISIENNTCTADLTDKMSAEVTYENTITQYEKDSDTSNAVNIATAHAKLLSLYLDYVGPKTISDSTMKNGDDYIEGYDPVKDEYTFQNKDVVLMAVYDDGTEVPVQLSDCTIDPPTVSGLSQDTSVTVNVTYTDKWGMTASNSFYVTNNLQVEQRYKINIDLKGGQTVVGGLETIEYSNLKKGVKITLPTSKEVVRDGYELTGFEIYSPDTGERQYSYNPGGVFTVQDMYWWDYTFYFRAIWSKVYPIKMAVQIWGIKQDKWADVDSSAAPDSVSESEYKQVGLTFGPATGKVMNSGRHHDAADFDTIGANPATINDLCIHDMSWERIIYWSKTKPEVFNNCLAAECTHSVNIELPEAMYNSNYSPEKYQIYQEWTGDGTGVLREIILPTVQRWSNGSPGNNSGGWSQSQMRSVLNGISTRNTLFTKDVYISSLLHALPDELEEGIVPKVVKSDGVFDDLEGNNITTYDKLWLFSTKEFYTDQDHDYIRKNEGETYQLQVKKGVTSSGNGSPMYTEAEERPNIWTRTISTTDIDSAVYIGWDMKPDIHPIYFGDCITLCFCLPGPEQLETANIEAEFNLFNTPDDTTGANIPAVMDSTHYPDTGEIAPEDAIMDFEDEYVAYAQENGSDAKTSGTDDVTDNNSTKTWRSSPPPF